MVTRFGDRSFNRSQNSILVHIMLDEWTVEVPLPEGARPLPIPTTPLFQLSWSVYLEPTMTAELLFGKFNVDRPLQDVVAFYRTQMVKKNWREVKSYGLTDTQFYFEFARESNNSTASITLVHPIDVTDTLAIIRYVIKHPYPPVSLPEESNDVQLHLMQEVVSAD